MAWLLFWAFLCLGVFNCRADMEDCKSSCGSLTNLKNPFRFKGDPKSCGHQDYQLSCESSRPVLYQNATHRRYYVLEISYKQQTMHVLDPGLRRDNCSSLPLYSSFREDYSEHTRLMWSGPGSVVFINCSQPVEDKFYVSTAPCIQSSAAGAYLYAIMGHQSVSDLRNFCRVVMNVPLSESYYGHPYPANYSEMHDLMMKGFLLSWYCYREGIFLRIVYCGIGPNIVFAGDIALYVFMRTAIGILCFLIFLVYKLQTKHIWMDTTVEEFLCTFRCQMPRRYSYSQIKKMTKNFKEKLGQRGYGSVFKGKLPNGHLVAVKVLKKAKANVQEFINEVATIGRIHHVNIVRLIGFCSAGSKRALIYEFMPNGSLEKHIFSQGGNSSLCWNKMYQIAIGIAHGIEYLHQGCDMQILHFDIKPHNILLDHKFNPKVSDFGLAKFYPTKESIVSITAVRGTIGYIALELLNRNIGGVSYKSDVYSFGMLLMEMVGRRKNIDVFAEHSSQIYFPSWIYDQLDKKGDQVMEDLIDVDRGIAKKLIVVALWCIQLKPVDRPSMSKVVEMLEGNVEELQIPPRPLLSSTHMTNQEHQLAN